MIRLPQNQSVKAGSARSLLSRGHNFSSLLYFLLLLLLPTQLGKHFWPPFAFVHGLRIDYLSPTVYLTDLLLLLAGAVWVLPHLNSRMNQIIFFLKLPMVISISGLLLLNI